MRRDVPNAICHLAQGAAVLAIGLICDRSDEAKSKKNYENDSCPQ